MKKFEIEDKKTFMNELFSGEKYDSFYMLEAVLRTGIDYHINGKTNMEYYDKEDLEEAPLDEYICWKNVKATVHDMIKGKNLPLSFKLVLMFNRDNIVRLVEMNNLPVGSDDIGALFLNIYYEKGELTATTGTSLKSFSLDKSIDHVWDDTVERYYV